MKWFLLVIGSVACTLVGWLLGQPSPPPAPPTPAPKLADTGQPDTPPPPASPVIGEALDRIAAQVRNKHSSTELIIRVFEEMKDLRPEDFPGAVAAMRQSAEISGGSGLLAGYWAERDLEGAKKWLMSLSADQREQYASSIASTWGRIDPGSMFAWLEGLPNDELRKLSRTIMPLLSHGAPGLDAARVAELFLAMPSQDQQASEFSSLFQWWTPTPPTAAAEKALTLPAGAARSAAVGAVVSAWAERDAQAALDWAQRLPDATLAARALPAYAKGLARKDPRAAIEFVADLPATEANQDALKSVVQTWAANDTPAALDWAKKLDDASLRGRVLTSMIETLAQIDTDTAARVYAEHGSEVSFMDTFAGIDFARDYARKQGLDAVLKLAAGVQGWESEVLVSRATDAIAERSPDEATAWALKQPEGFARSAALKSVVDKKYQMGDRNIVEWLRTLPKTPSSNPALTQQAFYRFSDDPETSVELLGRVSNREIAHNVLINSTESWLKRNAPAARAWIEKTSALNAQEKANFLRSK